MVLTRSDRFLIRSGHGTVTFLSRYMASSASVDSSRHSKQSGRVWLARRDPEQRIMSTQGGSDRLWKFSTLPDSSTSYQK